MIAPLEWGAATAWSRGPVVTSPAPDRNAIGVHAGTYATYRALAVATGNLYPNHQPDYNGTQPAVAIGPFPQWSDPSKIVTFDPWGHRTAQDFRADIIAGRRLRPSIAVTTGHLDIAEVAQAIADKALTPDGTVLLQNGHIAVTKIAIEPVWYLPGIAARLGINERDMRQAIVDHSGGMYPELVGRTDLKLFLPPIGGASVYLFGNPALLGQRQARITCRVHDECNGSDVFGSDLCTCRPYLMHGIEECIRGAQAGGLGIVIYNRKEGRALGEVMKLLVYNARKRADLGDVPEAYFQRTCEVAGVEDMRLQALFPDILHWLGVRRIWKWVSMSNLKSAALLAAGIAIETQIEIPMDRVSTNAQVEITAKIASGYFNGWV